MDFRAIGFDRDEEPAHLRGAHDRAELVGGDRHALARREEALREHHVVRVAELLRARELFHTDDARALYETLQERGVTDFTQEPIDHFYGTDMGLRDPFGNAIRILERKTSAAATA